MPLCRRVQLTLAPSPLGQCLAVNRMRQQHRAVASCPSSWLNVYGGPAGDHNDRAMSAVGALGEAFARHLGVPCTAVGAPLAADPAAWDVELARATSALQEMAYRIEAVMRAGRRPITAITRCAVALATLPVVLRYRPEAVVVWLDAHGDLNTPRDTETGYLGGMALSGPLGWWDSGLGAGLPASQVVLVGARDLDAAETAHLDAGRITLVPPGPMIGDRLANALGNRPAYLHLDCDVLQPDLFTTDYLMPDGLTLTDLHACAAATEGNVIGLEVAEYEGDSTATAHDLVNALRPLLDD